MYHTVYESRNVGTEREMEHREGREQRKWALESLEFFKGIREILSFYHSLEYY